MRAGSESISLNQFFPSSLTLFASRIDGEIAFFLIKTIEFDWEKKNSESYNPLHFIEMNSLNQITHFIPSLLSQFISITWSGMKWIEETKLL